jgi:penicillin-binding protein 2
VSDRSRLRLVVLQALVISLLLTLLGRLWYVQIYSGDKYRAAATNNNLRSVVTEAVRGQILDDEGRPLVSNRTSLVVSIDRSVLDQMSMAQEKAVLTRLADKLKTTPQALSDRITLCGSPGAKKPPICWNGSPFQPIPVARDVTSDLALSILEDGENLPGVSANLEAIRDYPAPYKANAAQILGYIGPVSQSELDASAKSKNPLYQYDSVGKTGLEYQYDDALRGVNGVKQLSVDQSGNVTGTLSQTAPVPGDNLVTNIDARVQATLEQQLVAAIQRARSQRDRKGAGNYKADAAAGVVMDVRTGAVIAMASLPTYDPSIWVGGVTNAEYAALTASKTDSPLQSLAYQGGFAPGSTFKVVSSTAMLQSGRYTQPGPYDCPAYYKVGTRTFFNDENRGGGTLTLKGAIEKSCDTVFYKVAFSEWLRDGGLSPKGKAADIFINAALAWGFGKPTGLDLPGESPGSIETRAGLKASWQQMRPTECRLAVTGYPQLAKTNPSLAAQYKAYAYDACQPAGALYQAGDAVNFIIGQGQTLVTPLKLAQVYAAIANGGTLWTPQVGKAVLSPTGQVVSRIKPVAEGKLPINSTTLAFLQDALKGVTTSGTSQVQFQGFPLSQIPVASKTGTAEVAGRQTTSWFATYAPATSKPEYAVVMMVSQGGFGSTTSASSVRAVYESLFGIKGNAAPNPKLSILPGGAVPVKLPVITADGTILPPGSKVPPAVPLTPPASPGSPVAGAATLGQAFALPSRRAGGGGP